jgi:hypothetical protein
LFSILAFLVSGASAGYSETISLTGTFTHDDDVQLFLYTVQNQGAVTIFTTSFATGGFAPILTLFDASGNFLFANTGSLTNDCVNNATDPVTGACWDARLTEFANNGTQFILALTEDDNASIFQNKLSDGFTEQGNGNFTGEPPFGPPTGGSFLLSSGVQRTADWAVTFQSTDPTLSVQAVPEPSTVALLLTGASLIGIGRRSRKTNR